MLYASGAVILLLCQNRCRKLKEEDKRDTDLVEHEEGIGEIESSRILIQTSARGKMTHSSRYD